MSQICFMALCGKHEKGYIHVGLVDVQGEQQNAPGRSFDSTVLTCTHNLCFEQKYEKIYQHFKLKINIFTAVKYGSILHRRVCIMQKNEITKITDIFLKRTHGKLS